MVRGGPDEGEPQGNIHSSAERNALERCHPHVMIGCDHGVQFTPKGTKKYGIGRKRTFHRQPFAPELSNDGRKEFLFLRAK
jgi:hypothetical protein